MTFRLYSNGSCTTQVDNIARNDVSVEDGLFSVKLDVNPAHFNGQGLWLGVDVGNTGTNIVCDEILPAPYALSLRPGAVISGTATTELTVRTGASNVVGEGAYGAELAKFLVLGGAGVYAYSHMPGYGVYGKSDHSLGRGVYGHASASSGANYGVYGQSDSTGGRGVHGYASASSGITYGVYGESRSTSGIGVYGKSDSGTGVYGHSLASHGVEGYGCSSPGCYGGYFKGYRGITVETDGGGEAGHFIGDVTIRGNLGVDGTAGFHGPVWFQQPVTFQQPIEINDNATFGRRAEFEGVLINQQLGVVGSALFEDSVEFNGPVSGSFPRPAWSSGWVSIPQGSWTTLNHNLGGDPDVDYFVDMQCKADGWGINNRGVGGYPLDRLHREGASYSNLTSSSVKVYRFSQDDLCSQVRIHIWVIQ